MEIPAGKALFDVFRGGKPPDPGPVCSPQGRVAFRAVVFSGGQKVFRVYLFAAVVAVIHRVAYPLRPDRLLHELFMPPAVTALCPLAAHNVEFVLVRLFIGQLSKLGDSVLIVKVERGRNIL